MTVAAEDRYQTIRHSYREGIFARCWYCGKAQSNQLHRTGSRCSMCFKYLPHYALDASRRCDECRP